LKSKLFSLGGPRQGVTSADNYVIALTQEPKPSEAVLLLAAGLAVDTVYKES
jgi:hypothetical protein